VKRVIRPVIAVLGITAMTFSVMLSVFFSSAVVNHSKYEVLGVDVSHYQGVVDWKKLEMQGVEFAFVKATEGSSHVDESVEYNLSDVQNTDIRISCYHFFSFDSAGETQAQNFINAVDRDKINMPPVVDIEYYGEKIVNKPSLEETEKILRPLLEILESYYGTKPVIYSTMPVYMRYLREKFSDYPLWIRSTRFEPDVIDWKFWQYSDHGLLKGYKGEEKYIDLNVYNGSREDFIKEFPEKF